MTKIYNNENREPIQSILKKLGSTWIGFDFKTKSIGFLKKKKTNWMNK